MYEWIQLILVVAAGSAISLLGGIYMLYGKRGAATLQKIAVPFAAGALLAAAFLDLLPEALHDDSSQSVLMAVLVGFLAFFILERSLHWFHHHHADDATEDKNVRTIPLIVIGDLLHNFIDGLAIGSAFLVSPATGVIVTIAIAAHEIPQEIGDFGLLLAKGMKKRSVMLVNVISGLITIVGAAIVYGFGAALSIDTTLLMALTAGFFIYIAASDIIPTIHAEPSRQVAAMQTIILLFAVIAVGVITELMHGFFPEA